MLRYTCSLSMKQIKTPPDGIQPEELGAADRIRTCGLSGRSRTIYPAELQPHIYENRCRSEFQAIQFWVNLRRQRGKRRCAQVRITRQKLLYQISIQNANKIYRQGMAGRGILKTAAKRRPARGGSREFLALAAAGARGLGSNPQSQLRAPGAVPG